MWDGSSYFEGEKWSFVTHRGTCKGTMFPDANKIISILEIISMEDYF